MLEQSLQRIIKRKEVGVAGFRTHISEESILLALLGIIGILLAYLSKSFYSLLTIGLILFYLFYDCFGWKIKPNITKTKATTIAPTTPGVTCANKLPKKANIVISPNANPKPKPIPPKKPERKFCTASITANGLKTLYKIKALLITSVGSGVMKHSVSHSDFFGCLIWIYQ